MKLIHSSLVRPYYMINLGQHCFRSWRIAGLAPSHYQDECWIICKCILANKLELRYNDITLQWRHNGRFGVSNNQPHDCLLNRLFRCRSKKTSKLRVTGLCAGNWPVTGEFPAQMASIAENVSIWWRHHETFLLQNRYLKMSSRKWQLFCQYFHVIRLYLVSGPYAGRYAALHVYPSWLANYLSV